MAGCHARVNVLGIYRPEQASILCGADTLVRQLQAKFCGFQSNILRCRQLADKSVRPTRVLQVQYVVRGYCAECSQVPGKDVLIPP
jgi:hypothetical protein